MEEITIWHNPRCSKSREALNFLQEKKIALGVIKYLDAKFTKEDIKEVLQMLNMSARELMRTKEDIYKQMNLKDETDEEKLIKAMVDNPKLIERPIIIKDGRAVIGRPLEKINELL